MKRNKLKKRIVSLLLMVTVMVGCAGIFSVQSSYAASAYKTVSRNVSTTKKVMVNGKPCYIKFSGKVKIIYNKDTNSYEIAKTDTSGKPSRYKLTNLRASVPYTFFENANKRKFSRSGKYVTASTAGKVVDMDEGPGGKVIANTGTIKFPKVKIK